MAVMLTGVEAQNTYYYRPSSSNRYRTIPSVAVKKSINSINSIDGDDFDSFKPNYNSFIKPYNPFTSGWGRPSSVQQKPVQYKWKPDFDSYESDESDEYYRRPSKTSKPMKTVAKPISYYNSDSNESDEVYRRVIAKPSISSSKKAMAYYHSDESDEDVYRRFLASYRKF
jgi:hypothetical protein